MTSQSLTQWPAQTQPQPVAAGAVANADASSAASVASEDPVGSDTDDDGSGEEEFDFLLPEPSAAAAVAAAGMGAEEGPSAEDVLQLFYAQHKPDNANAAQVAKTISYFVKRAPTSWQQEMASSLGAHWLLMFVIGIGTSSLQLM